MQDMPRSLRAVSVVETPEQIELNLPLAGFGSRGVALIIDMVYQGAFISVIFVLSLSACGFGGAAQMHGGKLDPEAFRARTAGILALLMLATFVVNFFYFTFFDLVWRGQSPGKRYMNLRVVRDGGAPLDFRSSLLRNLLRIVDMLPSGYTLGAAALFIGTSSKRIGDYAAGTIVIAEDPTPDTSIAPIVQTDAQRATTTGVRLTEQQCHLLGEFLHRRESMDPDARKRLARMIADQLAAHTGVSVGDAPEAYLEQYRDHVRD